MEVDNEYTVYEAWESASNDANIGLRDTDN